MSLRLDHPSLPGSLDFLDVLALLKLHHFHGILDFLDLQLSLGNLVRHEDQQHQDPHARP